MEIRASLAGRGGAVILARCRGRERAGDRSLTASAGLADGARGSANPPLALRAVIRAVRVSEAPSLPLRALMYAARRAAGPKRGHD
jgi:hypothetical protein